MVDKKRIEEEIEKTLAAYDNDVILEGNPFLMTRINEIRNKKSNIAAHKLSIKLLANLAVYFFLLLLNIATLVIYLKTDHQKHIRKQLLDDLKQEFQIEQSQNEL